MPAHTSHVLQPLDTGVFGPVKGVWRRLVKEFYSKHNFKNIDKNSFILLLKELYLALKNENAVAGFRSSGLFPLDQTKVLKNDILKLSETLVSSSVEQSSSVESSSIRKKNNNSILKETSEKMINIIKSHFKTAESHKKTNRMNISGVNLTDSAMIEQIKL